MKIAIIFSAWSTGARPMDFNVLWSSERGLTGSDLGVVMVAEELGKMGFDVSLFCAHKDVSQKPEVWNGVKLYDISECNETNTENFDVLISWSDPNVFFTTSKKPLKMVYQMLNDFTYAQPNFDSVVDVWVSVSDQLTQHLLTKENCPPAEKWKVVPLGANPSWYTDQRTPGRVVWCSSPDRGLHWLLQEWPKIKAAVPHADLRIFYNFNYSSVENIEPNSNNHPHFKEMGNRARYMKETIKRLKHFGVLQLGSCSRERMQYEMSCASVLAFPVDTITFSEGFSVATLEAHASYTVPIITDKDCMGSVYKNSGAIIIKSPVKDNLSEFTSSVIRALTDKPFADEVISKCMKFAADHTWAKTAEKLIMIAEEKIGKKNE